MAASLHGPAVTGSSARAVHATPGARNPPVPGSLVESPAAVCVICQEGMHAGEDALFVGPCGHTFHVQCAETNFVVGGNTTCPLCRAPFSHAPGFIAMARAEAQGTHARSSAPFQSNPQPRNENAQRHAFAVLPEVRPLAHCSAAAHPRIGSDFAKCNIQTDVCWLKPGRATPVTALVTVKYADDDDSNPVHVPTDFVLLADVSGSMSGDKLMSLKDALMKLSNMFAAHDRVALVAFDHEAKQLTPLAPITADADQGAAFRRAAMFLQDAGGTNITDALGAAQAILSARASELRARAGQVLLLTDGMDPEAWQAPALTDGVCLCTVGFGADHDADLLASLAGKSVPKGTFTFVQHNNLLDETMAGYVGDVTRVLMAQTKLVLAPMPGTITTILRVMNAPGAARHLTSGAVEIDLGMARVDGAIEVMIELMVATPMGDSSCEALSVTVEGTPVIGASTTVITPPVVLRLDVKDAETSPNARVADAMAAAHNRNRVAVAASALATVSTVAHASDVIAAARSTMCGPPTAREEAELRLVELERSLPAHGGSSFGEMQILSRDTAVSISSGCSSKTAPSKGARAATHSMQLMKASTALVVIPTPNTTL